MNSDNNSLKTDFSYAHYLKMLQEIKKTHKTFSFGEAAKLGINILDIDKFVIMRHDVEISLVAALKLAEIDASEGIKSTFFLLQTGDYNCFQKDSAEQIKKIIALGHEIGLHYDGALFENLNINAEYVIQKQIEMFELFFNTKIYSMSSHMPMRSGVTVSLPNIIDVYNQLYIVDMKYISDSTQVWREDAVTNLLNKYTKIHLLTHEFIWHEKNYSWESLLLIDAHEKFNTFWNRGLETIDMCRAGLKLREKKDAEFKKRYGEP